MKLSEDDLNRFPELELIGILQKAYRKQKAAVQNKEV